MERLSVSSVHKEQKLGAHQHAPHHNLYLHHGKHPQAPGLEDLAQSARPQQSQKHTWLFPRAIASPIAICHLIDSVAVRLKAKDLTHDEDMHGDRELRR